MALTDDQLFGLSFDFFTHRADSFRGHTVTRSVEPIGSDVGSALVAYARAAIALAEEQEPIPL